MQKTSWQIIKTLSFRDANLCVTLGALVKPLFLAREGMSLQAFTAERMKASDGLEFGVRIQTNQTCYMLFEVFKKRLHHELQTKTQPQYVF